MRKIFRLLGTWVLFLANLFLAAWWYDNITGSGIMRPLIGNISLDWVCLITATVFTVSINYNIAEKWFID